jgi:hypothetical protein
MNITFKKKKKINSDGSKETNLEINTDVLKHIKEDVSKAANATVETVKKTEKSIHKIMFVVHRIISMLINLAYLIYGLLLFVELTPVYFSLIEKAVKNNNTLRAMEVGLIYFILILILIVMVFIHRWYKKKFLPNTRWF